MHNFRNRRHSSTKKKSGRKTSLDPSKGFKVDLDPGHARRWVLRRKSKGCEREDKCGIIVAPEKNEKKSMNERLRGKQTAAQKIERCARVSLRLV